MFKTLLKWLNPPLKRGLSILKVKPLSKINTNKGVKKYELKTNISKSKKN